MKKIFLLITILVSLNINTCSGEYFKIDVKSDFPIIDIIPEPEPIVEPEPEPEPPVVEPPVVEPEPEPLVVEPEPPVIVEPVPPIIDITEEIDSFDPEYIRDLILVEDTEVVEPIEPVEPVEPTEIKHVKEERDIFAILFGSSMSGVLAFIARITYLWYKSKTGQIIITKIKNDINELENDIIEKISKITDLETGELAREKLRNIQQQLLVVAKEKLDPIINTEEEKKSCL